MADTPDQKAAETQGRAIDGRIFRLNEERAMLVRAPERIAEIDAELAALAPDKARIDVRRPPRPAISVPVDTPPIVKGPPAGVR